MKDLATQTRKKAPTLNKQVEQLISSIRLQLAKVEIRLQSLKQGQEQLLALQKREEHDEFSENIIEDTISHHQICIEDMEIFLSYTYKEYTLIIDGLSVALTLEDKKAKQGMLKYISKHAGFVDVAMNHTIAEYEDIIPKLKESRAFWL